jgi:hypothetical protein
VQGVPVVRVALPQPRRQAPVASIRARHRQKAGFRDD